MASEGGDRRATVLVVDDDPSTRRSLVRALEQDGHMAVEASNGLEGLQMLQDLRPDLVLLDVDLPRLDGFAVLAAMQDLPCVARTPVVMVARADDAAAVSRCLEMGAVDYLLTPADPQILARRVHAALGP